MARLKAKNKKAQKKDGLRQGMFASTDKKKYYRVDLNVTSTAWETCECYIQAESAEEARKKFDADPETNDWDNWEHSESEIRNWDVERVELDEWMTIHMADPEKSHEQIKREIQLAKEEKDV